MTPIYTKDMGQHHLDCRQTEFGHLISEMMSLKILVLAGAHEICHQSCVFSFLVPYRPSEFAITLSCPSIGNKNQQGISTG
jgi:hypothetical protein